MYRNFQSSNPPASVVAQLKARGIADHGTALFGLARTQRTEVFVMDDGRTVPCDSRVIHEAARAAGEPYAPAGHVVRLS